jgi:hypothetical protein
MIAALKRCATPGLYATPILCVLGVLCGSRAQLTAQIEMPDPKQMSGIPRPVTDLPDSAVSVRLIRGSLSNNITNHPVELHVGSKVQTAKTDDSGRAQFSGLTPGATLKAVAVVDGERLESQEFPAPSRGGIRLILVATDKTKKSEPVPTEPVSGQVAIGGDSRIVLEPGEEAVQVYYVLDIVNSARAPVNLATPFMFDTPTSAVGTTVIEGSSPQASVTGTRVRVQGPFAPGRTSVQIACELPASTGALQLTQRFPASLERLAVIVKKVGATTLSSPQIANQRDLTAEGQTFILASGGVVAADQPVVLSLGELPHHSGAPRVIALSLVVAIVGIGVWASRRPGDTAARVAERRHLIARRDKLFNDLVRLEREHGNGRGNQARYATRREELLAALEHIYGALDDDDTGPEPANHAGLAA